MITRMDERRLSEKEEKRSRRRNCAAIQPSAPKGIERKGKKKGASAGLSSPVGKKERKREKGPRPGLFFDRSL